MSMAKLVAWSHSQEILSVVVFARLHPSVDQEPASSSSLPNSQNVHWMVSKSSSDALVGV